MSSDTASDAASDHAIDRDIEAARPLFRIDPGWPFVIGGLLLVVAGVLIPAQRELHDLREAVEVQRAVEDQSVRQLAAYDRFLNDLGRGEPQLVKRLAASQLNLMPVGERPYMFAPTVHRTVTDWIEASEPLELPEPEAYPDTLLSRLSQGPRRLWVLACGVFLTFVGLMLGPTPVGLAAVRAVRRADRMDGDSLRGSTVDAVRGAIGTEPAVRASDAAVAVDETECAAVDRAEGACGEAVVEDELEDAVEDELEDAVEDEPEDAVEDELEDAVEDETEDAVEDALAGSDRDESDRDESEGDESEGDESEVEDAEETVATDRPVTGIARESRAETVALLGLDEEMFGVLDRLEADLAVDADDAAEGLALEQGRSEEPPSAYDRALDVRSLFEGLAPERWIDTGDPRARG